MAQREGLYTILSEKIVHLNEELIRFTGEAESVQKVVAKASEVTNLYTDMFRNAPTIEQLQIKKEQTK